MVLLRHEGHGAIHFDFMLEDGDTLATWQFDESPALLAPGGQLPCIRLSPHRRAYLDYEGQVSGDRGTVSRAAAGTYALLSATATNWSFKLHSPTLVGLFHLYHLTGPAWSLKKLNAS
jgi:hypothetical protein